MPKRKRHPHAPKKPTNAYTFFLVAQRPSIKASNPEASFSEIGKIIGAKWRALGDDQKKPYMEQASKDKERYEAERKQFMIDYPNSAEEVLAPKRGTQKKAKERKKKDPNEPKRGATAYLHFSKERRSLIKAANPTSTFGEIGKLVGEQWRALGALDRKKYEDMAAADKVRYETEMKAYREAHPPVDLRSSSSEESTSGSYSDTSDSSSD